jgi:hypothetical protein
MYSYLSEHPEIFLPTRKELHYFTHDYLTQNSNGPNDTEFQYCKTLEQYQVFFENVPSTAKAVGDVSPSYLFFPQCIPRIKGLLGDSVRIIAMLRNPIERAFSNYLHMVRANRETLTFFDALQAEEDRLAKGWRNIWMYKRHSLYSANVQRYIEEFGRLKFKVILYDDLAKDTMGTLQDMYRFLGVAPEFVPRNIDVIYAKGGGAKATMSFARRLFPHRVRRMLRKLKPSRTQEARADVLPDDRSVAFLKQYFEEDITRLEKLLRRDLSTWK